MHTVNVILLAMLAYGVLCAITLRWFGAAKIGDD